MKNSDLNITVDQVNHPPHYTSHPSGIEAIQITRHMNFNLGNAMKYIWRAGIKNEEKHIEDLKKAIFYINDEIKRLESMTPQAFIKTDRKLSEEELENIKQKFLKNPSSAQLDIRDKYGS